MKKIFWKYTLNGQVGGISKSKRQSGKREREESINSCRTLNTRTIQSQIPWRHALRRVLQ